MNTPNEQVEDIYLTFDQADQRLDSYIATALTDIARSQIQDWIKKGLVVDARNSAPLKASLKIKNEPIPIHIRRPIKQPFSLPEPEHRSGSLDIVFEDDHLIVLNKPSGLTVHPGAGRHNGTLVNLLLGHTGGALSSIGTHERPGIVHRLDKDTSGLMVVAKTNAVHVKLAEALKQRTLKRIYDTLVYKVPKPMEGMVHTFIGRDPHNRKRMSVQEDNQGKEAITHYHTLEQFRVDYAYVRCQLETGRTHQIRVHMAHIGCPVMGDPMYGGRHIRMSKIISHPLREAIEALSGQALHAGSIGFYHPVTEEYMEFTSEPPEDFKNVLSALRRY